MQLHMVEDVELVNAVARAVGKLLRFPECQGRQPAAYLCLAAGRDLFEPLLIQEIGHCGQEKAPKYREFSQEKAHRLFENPGHMSSWQTRDPDANKWGGAIRAGENGSIILSLSGLIEHADEAAVMSAALKFGWLGRERADMIKGFSKNPLIDRLMGW